MVPVVIGIRFASCPYESDPLPSSTIKFPVPAITAKSSSIAEYPTRLNGPPLYWMRITRESPVRILAPTTWNSTVPLPGVRVLDNIDPGGTTLVMAVTRLDPNGELIAAASTVSPLADKSCPPSLNESRTIVEARAAPTRQVSATLPTRLFGCIRHSAPPPQSRQSMGSTVQTLALRKRRAESISSDGTPNCLSVSVPKWRRCAAVSDPLFCRRRSIQYVLFRLYPCFGMMS